MLSVGIYNDEEVGKSHYFFFNHNYLFEKIIRSIFQKTLVIYTRTLLYAVEYCTTHACKLSKTICL